MKKTRFLIHLSLFLLLSSVMGIYQWFESPVHSQDAPPPIEVSGASFVHDMGIVAPQIAALTTEQQTLGNRFIIEGASMKNNWSLQPLNNTNLYAQASQRVIIEGASMRTDISLNAPRFDVTKAPPTVKPTRTPTPTHTPTLTPTPTSTSTPTLTSTPTSTSTPTLTPTPTETPSPTAVPTETPLPTATPIPASATPLPTATTIVTPESVAVLNETITPSSNSDATANSTENQDSGINIGYWVAIGAVSLTGIGLGVWFLRRV